MLKKIRIVQIQLRHRRQYRVRDDGNGDYESVELTLFSVRPSDLRRAELVAVLSWRLVCSCIMRAYEDVAI